MPRKVNTSMDLTKVRDAVERRRAKKEAERDAAFPSRVIIFAEPSQERLLRMIDTDDAMRIVDIDQRSEPWRVTVACACAELALKLEDGWG